MHVMSDQHISKDVGVQRVANKGMLMGQKS